MKSRKRFADANEINHNAAVLTSREAEAATMLTRLPNNDDDADSVDNDNYDDDYYDDDNDDDYNYYDH